MLAVMHVCTSTVTSGSLSVMSNTVTMTIDGMVIM